MKEYTIIETAYSQELAQKVTKHAAEGWEPCGGIAVGVNVGGPGRVMLYQMLARELPEPEPVAFTVTTTALTEPAAPAKKPRRKRTTKKATEVNDAD